MILDFLKTIGPVGGTLLSVIIGWTLSQIASNLKTRFEDRRLCKEVVFSLLEFYQLARRFNACIIGWDKFHPDQGNEVNLPYYTWFEDDFIQKNLRLTQAVDKLARVYPLFALELVGIAAPFMHFFDHEKQSEESMKEVERQNAPDTIEKIKLHRKTILLENKYIAAIHETCVRIKIQQLAFKLGILFWLQVKVKINSIKEKHHPDAVYEERDRIYKVAKDVFTPELAE